MNSVTVESKVREKCHKKCYPCDNFDDFFPCNFGTEHSKAVKAVKLGMMQEIH